MSFAAEILIQPSRRLAGAVVAMALTSNLALSGWLLALWRNQGPAEPDPAVLVASGLVTLVWIASCVPTWIWWRSRAARRLVIEGNGEAFWLDRPDSRGAQGAQSPGACRAVGSAAAADRRQAALRYRPLPGSLIWPGIISLQFVADAAQQQPQRRSGASSPAALVVLADSVSPTEHRALALWMHWLQRKGVAPQVRATTVSLRF